jgi:hypothetical protein
MLVAMRDVFCGVVAFLFEKKRDKGKQIQVEGMEDERGRGKGMRIAGARTYLRRQRQERGEQEGCALTRASAMNEVGRAHQALQK